MTAKRYIDIYEAYDRFYEGERVREDQWDFSIVPTNAAKMKEKYDISIGPDIIPDDPDLCDRLFLAGVDMLLTTGFYNPDIGRILHITEEELFEGMKMAPKKLTLGHG